MATKEALESLEKTGNALVEIKKQLKPFVKRLETAEGKALAQAQAAVALSVGTLRFMGVRLLGETPDEKLRQELNEMRRVLTAVEKLKDDNDSGSKKEAKQSPKKNASRKRKSAEDASEKKKIGSDEKTKASKEKGTSPSPKKRQRKC